MAHGRDDEALTLASAWNFKPWVLALMAPAGGGYLVGLRRLRSRAGSGRGLAPRQVLWFGLGWLTLAVALVSPLDSLGDHLFSAHMVQHELLMIVAAPLLVLGRPLGVWIWCLSPAQRHRLRLAD